MSKITHDDIRREIMEILYKSEREEPSSWGVDRGRMLRALEISESDMDYDMVFLELRSLVRLVHTDSVIWFMARITPFGMTVMENKEEYKLQFPFLRATKSK